MITFITEDAFRLRIAQGTFYEYAPHGPYFYGTGLYEWKKCDIFIMETHGISLISKEDRKNCFIIYLNPPIAVRIQRLKEVRCWTDEQIEHRTKMDEEKFKDFTDFDMEITSSDF